MKLKGFTLTEVLITIAIIGVVATLTLPALNVNVQRQQAGPALLRAIATLDTANSIMFVEQDMISFADSCSNYVDDCFGPFIARRMGAASVTPGINYQDFGELQEGQETMGGAFRNAYATKNGFIYYFEQGTGGNVTVRIDINGVKGPNIVGRDLFYATIRASEDGKVYATGSLVAGVAGEAPLWRNGNCDRTSVNDARTCAGSIIDNGGSVIYNW